VVFFWILLLCCSFGLDANHKMAYESMVFPSRFIARKLVPLISVNSNVVTLTHFSSQPPPKSPGFTLSDFSSATRAVCGDAAICGQKKPNQLYYYLNHKYKGTELSTSSPSRSSAVKSNIRNCAFLGRSILRTSWYTTDILRVRFVLV
jgi:hypothetical protein